VAKGWDGFNIFCFCLFLFCFGCLLACLLALFLLGGASSIVIGIGGENGFFCEREY